MTRSRLLAILGVALAACGGGVALVAGGGRAIGWAVAVSALLASVGALALVLSLRGEPHPRRPAIAVLALAIVAWCAAGALPMPGRLLGAIAPRRETIERAVPRGEGGVATWAAAVSPAGRSLQSALGEPPRVDPALTAPLGEPVIAPISYAPWATRTAVVVLLAFLVLLVSLASRRSERPAMLLVAACCVFALVAAVAGLWYSRHAPGLLWGRLAPADPGGTRPYGAMWSPNHAAALFALTCPVLLGCALDAGRALLVRIAALFALAPVAAALLDAGSRGGLLAGGLAALLLGAFLVRHPGRRAAGAALLTFALAGIALAFTVLAPRLIHESYAQTTSMRGSNLERRELYRLEERIIREAPLTGTGLGAFKTAHGAFRTEPGYMLPLHGESDWLETGVEGGIPLLLLWIALIAALLAPALRLAVAGRAPPLLAGVLAGSVAVIAHAAVDFHLREPLVALAAIACAGACSAWALRLTTEQREAEAPRAPRLTLVAASACVVLAAFVARREIPRDRASRDAEARLASGDADGAAQAAGRATHAAPRDGDAWALLGWAEDVRAQQSKPGKERIAHRAAAIEASVHAIAMSPATLGAARRCATILLQAGADEKAADAVRLALLVSPGAGATQRVAGQLLLRSGDADAALERLAFSFRALPPWRISQESRALTAQMLEAAQGDAPKAMRAAGESDRVAWFVAELARLNEDEALRACLASLASDPPTDAGAPDRLASLVTLSDGPESLDLARRLAGSVTDPAAKAAVEERLKRGSGP